MLSHFLDCISPQSLSGVRSWFRAVADVSSQSDLLGPAVQGISNLFFALQTNDHALLRESQGRHVMALAKLRQEIAEPSINTGYFALYSTMLLVFYELASFNSPFSWIVHLGGAEKIVKHLGPSAFSRGLPHDTFVLFSFFSVRHHPILIFDCTHIQPHSSSSASSSASAASSPSQPGATSRTPTRRATATPSSGCWSSSPTSP